MKVTCGNRKKKKKLYQRILACDGNAEDGETESNLHQKLKNNTLGGEHPEILPVFVLNETL